MHPWLGVSKTYLDLIQNHISGQGEIYDNYATWETKPNDTIPKNTSAIKATYKVIPEIKINLLQPTEFQPISFHQQT